METYLCDKFNWSSAQFNSIAWNYLAQVYFQSTSCQIKAFTKAAFKLWATNERRSIESNRHDHRCSRCSRLHEDWLHIFCCPSPSSTINHDRILQQLKDTLQQYQASQPMVKCLIIGTTKWLKQEPIPFPYSLDDSDLTLCYLHSAFCAQLDLGWDQLFCGRLHQDWYKAHDYYCASRELHSRFHSRYFGPALTKTFLSMSLTTWKARNDAIFGSTKEEQKQRRHQKLNESITLAYDDPDIYTPEEQQILFSLDLQALLKKDIPHKQRWLSLKSTIDNPPKDDSRITQHCYHQFFTPFLSAYQSTSNT